ncbi:protein Gds1p [[Candida] anglica]
MALADRRPLNFPESSTPASPSFNPKTLNLVSSSNGSSSVNGSSDPILAGATSSVSSDTFTYKSKVNEIKGKFAEGEVKPLTPEKSLSPVELSPTSRSISPDSLMNPDSLTRLNSSSSSSTSPPSYGAVPKKIKTSSRAPIATGISTTIPVTGEKPRPEQKNDASLQDDVLYAIFVILYEKDPEGQGMTVKQICDTLVEQHPEMANLSTKTSNLVSAKLNAYVKRVEKGDANLKYALSRDWADASPKRMVYVYRGLLTDDFHLHVKSAMEIQKQQQQLNQVNVSSSFGSNGGEFGGKKLDVLGGSLATLPHQSLAQSNQQPHIKPRRQTMYDLGVTKNTFLDTPIDKANLFVPYSSAPVTASFARNNDNNSDGNNSNSLNIRKGTDEAGNDDNHSSNESPTMSKMDMSDMEFEDFEVFDDNDEDDDMADIESFKAFNKAKRSKSLSYLTMNKKPRILTAAAAAPRASRAPSSHSPNAAAAAAALHAAAIKAMLQNHSTSATTSSTTSASTGSSPATSDVSSSETTIKTASSLENKKWLNVVRSGFLTQDIGTPEDISLSDLDKFFN